MSVNGRSYDWEDVSITLPHGEAVNITEIKYSDEQTVTSHYGKGAIPRGYGRGNYSATGSMVLDRQEYERLVPYLRENGKGIYDHDPFTIVVNYANDDQGTITDTLKSVKISKQDGGGGAQGDDKVTAMSLDLVILEPILWNGVPAKK